MSPIQMRKEKMTAEAHKVSEERVIDFTETQSPVSSLTTETPEISEVVSTTPKLERVKSRIPENKTERPRQKPRQNGQSVFRDKVPRSRVLAQNTLRAGTPGFRLPGSAVSKNARARLQKLRYVPNAQSLPNVNRIPYRGEDFRLVPEWRMFDLQDRNGAEIKLMIDDSRESPTIVGRHLDERSIAFVKDLVRLTDLQVNSPADHLSGPAVDELIANFFLDSAKERARDVKVREPNPERHPRDDAFLRLYVPNSLFGQFNWPKYNQAVELCVTTDFSEDLDVATYQKWIIGHEQYGPHGFPLVQRFLPTVKVNGIEPYSFTVVGPDGGKRHMESNASGVIVSCTGDHLEGVYDDKIKQITELAFAHLTELNVIATQQTFCNV